MSATESTPEPMAKSEPCVVPGVSMRELLAAGAAARAVSTPPRAPDAPKAPVRHPKAA
ncbi:hypothetical protein [Streptomyces graminilatus]|uniref:hypothetical protein n=1 Tax=Streptomyces graminilatus TaxID=1464070 RepID=UPI000AD62522|nr:hypothetical protein [Streptomyces graminilatus]